MPPPPTYNLEIIEKNHTLEHGSNLLIWPNFFKIEFHDGHLERAGIIIGCMMNDGARHTVVLRDNYHPGEVWRSPDPDRTFYDVFLRWSGFVELDHSNTSPLIFETQWAFRECDFNVGTLQPRSRFRFRLPIPPPKKLKWQVLGF